MHKVNASRFVEPDNFAKFSAEYFPARAPAAPGLKSR